MAANVESMLLLFLVLRISQPVDCSINESIFAKLLKITRQIMSLMQNKPEASTNVVCIAPRIFCAHLQITKRLEPLKIDVS